MKDFYNSYYKNYLKKLISLVMTISLLVSNCLPVFADVNSAGVPGSYSIPVGSGYKGYGNAISDTKGGYRFSLHFLSKFN